MAFCEWLTKKEEKYYDLPTEAEWEYACRADGAPGQVYCFGNDPQQLVEYAWFGEPTSSGSTHAVGTKQPNNWGLYDMHGNVWEWCKDGPRKYPDLATAQKQQDPLEKSEGPLDGPSRVVRGGSWLNLVPKACRSARRYVYERGFRGSNVGFRVVLRPVPENP